MFRYLPNVDRIWIEAKMTNLELLLSLLLTLSIVWNISRVERLKEQIADILETYDEDLEEKVEIYKDVISCMVEENSRLQELLYIQEDR